MQIPKRIADYFGLERNVVVVSLGILLLGFGENLWKKFIPKYMQALGAPMVGIGAYGSLEDFLDGVYQYPGGWLSDRYGRRSTLNLLLTLSAFGYLIYLVAPSWHLVAAGLLFVVAWKSMGSPTVFAVVGDALPKDRRAIAFTVQSILRRVPIVIAPVIGGLLIGAIGVIDGVRLALVVTLLASLLTWLMLRQMNLSSPVSPQTLTIRGVWATFPRPLRALLVSDVLIRTCEGMVDVFLVIYAIDIVGITATGFGALLAVQAIVSMIIYIPIAKLADRTGRKPFVIMTFLMFAAFPLTVVASHSFAMLTIAFAVAGLRELGEPSRKALILDLVEPHVRGRAVGLYYLIRSLLISPAAFAGGMLWNLSPSYPFIVASGFGLAGTLLFALTVREEYA